MGARTNEGGSKSGVRDKKWDGCGTTTTTATLTTQQHNNNNNNTISAPSESYRRRERLPELEIGPD